VNTLLYRRIHLDLRRTASSACPLMRWAGGRRTARLWTSGPSSRSRWP